MNTEKNWNEIKLGDAVMLKNGNNQLLVSGIVQDENQNVTHLLCVWDSDELQEKKLPIEVLREYKTYEERLIESALRVMEREELN